MRLQNQLNIIESGTWCGRIESERDIISIQPYRYFSRQCVLYYCFDFVQFFYGSMSYCMFII